MITQHVGQVERVVARQPRGRGALRRVVVAVVLTLAVATVPRAVGAAATVEKSAGSLTATPAQGIAGEPLTFQGKLKPAVARKVVLQTKQGGSWATVASARSSAKGAFGFATTVPSATSNYRVQAPRAKVKGTVYAAATTPVRTVTAQPQSGAFSLPATGALNSVADGLGSFSPSRPGRPVRLEVLQGGSWQLVDQHAEDGAGAVVFDVQLGVAGSRSYRLVADVANGAAAAVSPTRSIVVVPTVVPDTTPPGPVTGLAVTGTTTTTVSLSWTNPGDADLAGVVVRRALGATPPSSPTSGTLVADVPKPGSTVTDTGLSPGTQYAYAAFAKDAVPNYAAAATATATTAGAPDVTPPGPVTGLAVTGTTTTTVSLSWTNPGDADLAGVLVRRAQGATPPASPAAGTLVADVAKPGVSVTDTGLTPGTQYSYAVFAHDAVPNYATGKTVTTTTADLPTGATGDWAQSRHDPEHQGWAPGETVITPGNAGSVAEEWTADGGTPAIVGTTLYALSTEPLNGQGRLTALDLTTGAELWRRATGSCVAGPVSVTATLVVLGCSQPRAYALTGAHALVWDTADTDPGASYQNHLVIGSRVVAWSQGSVASYQLSDGQRAWQQLLPAGAGSIVDVAASGSSVVVAYDDRLRALASGNGSQQWSDAGITSSQVVVAGGFVYTNDDAGVSRYTLASGAVDGWTVPDNSDIYRIEAADADTVYVWEAVFDFGPPSPSVLHALRTSDGIQRWQYDVPSRVASVAVAGDVVWLVSTDIFSQGRNGDLIALGRATGAELRHVHWDDNVYGWTDVAFGGGKVVLHQGGSFGGSTPHTLRVLGLAGPRPAVTTAVLPLGRTGAAYSIPLSATGTAPFAWSVQSGALPSGLSLSAAGVLSGTPTAVGTSRFVVKVTGANGRSATRSLPLGVVTSGAPSWTTTYRDATRNPLEPGTGQLDLAEAPTFAFRWKTAPPGPTQFGDDQDVALAGTMLYTTGWDGTLKAFDTTGSLANRPPTWAVVPSAGTGAGYTGAPSISGTRILVFDTDRRLHAVSTANGADLWHTEQLSGPDDAPLVVGSAVYVRDSAYQVRAFSVTDGSPLWGGLPAGPVNFYSPLSSDGTRVFGVAGCELVALNAANGSVAWQLPIRLSPPGECVAALAPPPPPIVVAGKVYAAEPAGRAVVDAATGTVDLRFDAPAFGAGTGVVVGGLWFFPTDNRIVAVEVTSGERVWRSEDGVADGVRLSSTGDLLLAASSFGVTGVSRLTGESVFDGGSLQGVGGMPAIGTNRFFLTAQDGTRAYGPL